MSGNIGSLASNRNLQAPVAALQGVQRGLEKDLITEAKAGTSQLSDNSGGRTEIAKG